MKSAEYDIPKNEWCRCLYCRRRPRFDSLDELNKHIEADHDHLPRPGIDCALVLYMYMLVWRKPGDIKANKPTTGEINLEFS